MLFSFTTALPVGILLVKHDEHYVYQVGFVEKALVSTQSPSFAKMIVEEFKAYFNNPQHRFNLRLNPQGSHFQQKVWSALRMIPVGRTLTYGELADQLQTSPRAIGQACKTNPLTILIPCHRVVGKHNHGGYMGKAEALSYKIALLRHENCSDFVSVGG